MVTKEFAMPDLGEGLTESELVTWNVAEGDTVELNQVIAEVETAKALVQLPSPYAGVVARLFVEPGTTVEVGSPIMAFSVDDGASEDPPADGLPAPAEGVPGGDAEAADQNTGRNAVLVGYGPPVDGSARPRRRARRAGGPAAAASASTRRSEAPAAAEPAGSATGETATAVRTERPRSFPPVRKLANELGVDLTEVTGTGEDGLITREDVLSYAGSSETSPGSRSTNGSTVGTDQGGGDRPREVRTPITGVRKRTAAAMVASAFTAPHATEFLTVDVTPTVELLEQVRGSRAFVDRRVTVLTLAAKAVTIAVARTPAVNSRWDEDANEIVQYAYVNLGIAAATPRGLLVPNIKDADRLDLAGLADAITRLTQDARAGSTAPTDLTGGTISITNIGVFGIDAGTPILNPGEAAILALGAVRRQPWEYRDEIALRQVMTLSLSFDHRLVDGEQASRFLADVGTMLAHPGMTLAMV